MAERRNPELTWRNKHLWLEAVGDHGYEWLGPDDPQALATPALRHVTAVGDQDPRAPENLLIAGDSLHALRGLRGLPELNGSLANGIRLAYIDPPFNTGQAFAQFDDSLEHSMWLSMLRDRLAEVRELLAPLGSVWVHLDDTEVHHARCVLDEVFGPEAFIATIVWQKRTTRESRSAFSHNHDYIHVYAPAGPQQWKHSRNLLAKDISAFRNRDDDPRGPWADAPFTAPGYRPNQHYPIVNPAGSTLLPPKGRSWYATQPVYQRLLADNRIWFPKGGAGLPRMKLFPDEMRGLVPFSLWGPEDGGTNDDGKRHLMSLFPDQEPFATPKPEALMERIIHIASDPDDLVLDFFAGSGTTAAAAHKMGRRWIAIERSSEVVASFALPRLRMVVEGSDPGGITEALGWEGGGGFNVLEVHSESDSRAEREPLKGIISRALHLGRRRAAVDGSVAKATIAARGVSNKRDPGQRTLADELPRDRANVSK